MLLFLPCSILNIVIHSSCYSAVIASLMCYVASVRPCRIRITPKSWNRKWPQVKLRSELTISEQCSENISHKHALSYKKQRPTLRVGIRPRRQKNCFRRRTVGCSTAHDKRVMRTGSINFCSAPLYCEHYMYNTLAWSP